MKHRKIVFGFIYIVVCIAFIIAFSYVLSRLRDIGTLRYSYIYMLLPIILYTLVISIVFSFSHIKKVVLEKERKLIVKIPMIVVALLIIILIIHPYGPTFPSFISTYGQPIAYFILWYNLIHAFDRQNADVRIDQDEQPLI